MKVEQKIDLVVSFDTTGSMYPVLAKVRQEVEKFVHEMFKDFSDFRLSIIAHGDYCDKDNPYTIRVLDFTENEEKLCSFIKETKSTYGGDADECYELVLHTAHNELHWRDDAEHVMIMIGDASPHSPSYRDNYLKLDWKNEAEELRKHGIKVFAVHALANFRSSSRAFYKSVSETTGGIYLTLDMFSEIIDLIKATCYQQSGGEERLNEFITIIRDENRLTNSLDINFRRLKGEAVEEVFGTGSSYGGYRSSRRVSRASSSEPGKVKELAKLEPVPAGRFQTFTVPENVDIKGFVTSMGITFKKGRGFYELSKAETVQQYKEVIMQDRETGEMFVGSQVREELGLQPQTESGGVKERLHKSATEKFRVFVQSTSVNRKLIGGTTFLYEVDDLEDTGTIIEEVKTSDKTVEATGDVKEPVKVEKRAKKSTKTAKTEKGASKSTDTELSDGAKIIKSVVEKSATKPKLTSKAKASSKSKESNTSKKVSEEVLRGEKFDTELAKRSLEKSVEPDTMMLEAAKRAKSSKSGKSSTLKGLAKEHDLGLIDISSTKDADKVYKKTTKGRKKATKESEESKKVSSLASSALDEVKTKKEDDKKKALEAAEEKKRLAEEKKAEVERKKAEAEKKKKELEEQKKKAAAERERQRKEREKQKKEEAKLKKKEQAAKKKRDMQIKAKVNFLESRVKSLDKYVTEMNSKDTVNITEAKIKYLHDRLDMLSELVKTISEI